MKKIVKKLLSVLTISLTLASCDFPDLDFFVGDYENNQIINKDGNTISCQNEKLNKFSCLSDDDLIKLKNWIRNNCKD